MLKQYFTAIFLLSAVSLNAMHAPNPTINVRWRSDGKAIIASHSVTTFNGAECRETNVMKNIPTGTFDVWAIFDQFDPNGDIDYSGVMKADQDIVKLLEAEIAKLENKK
jgi:hypothetical protein